MTDETTETMTSISTFDDVIEQLHKMREQKENPEDWYFVQGSQVGEYSIQDAESPDKIPEDQSELPPEAQDATEAVDGFYQIGTQGWGADAFVDDINFVGEVGFSETKSKINRRTNGLLFVHKSRLSDMAISIAEDGEEVPADD
ncbi:hypothetical protein [Halorubrum tropicale]|uniref:Uncharacterized protein n=1 Tax=Halorubrum tropicale TaxID=1765655 RepID=A0A0M9AJE6_9EURY|nr:hypothetical protein [Halorubrum tropicale]KOX93249.1 hypothetical protein AMR74_16535 [Halorubrum tropicale]